MGVRCEIAADDANRVILSRRWIRARLVLSSEQVTLLMAERFPTVIRTHRIHYHLSAVFAVTLSAPNPTLSLSFSFSRNCLFRALADQLRDGHSNHVTIRRKVAQFIRDHKADFLPFIDSDIPFDKHGTPAHNNNNIIITIIIAS